MSKLRSSQNPECYMKKQAGFWHVRINEDLTFSETLYSQFEHNSHHFTLT